MKMLKQGRDNVLREWKNLFDLYHVKNEIPEEWENALVVLIYQKSDPQELKHYKIDKFIVPGIQTFLWILTNGLNHWSSRTNINGNISLSKEKPKQMNQT